jgi:hypothetical protein
MTADEVAEACARVCESRARSVTRPDEPASAHAITRACEAESCAEAIRAGAWRALIGETPAVPA